jgi:two-component system chemotaxis sensor kinase CheA
MESQPGTGTSFRLLLPLTIATFKGVLVRAAERDFILPSASIERVLRVQPGQINTVENRETVSFNGCTVALVRLDDLLGLARVEQDAAAPAFLPTLILRAANQSLAVRVDAVLGEQDVLVKSLGRQLARVRNIAGAAVSGTGKVVPILHVPDLIKSAVKGSAAMAAGPAANGNGRVKQPSVLVVEDSITSRTLLVSILQSAGYRVTAVVDGMEAWTLLHTEDFDVIVSDIEMPRMNGFDLTARIRAGGQRADQPVVLVTSLDSRADRERGIDVGANAYIVKSSFDQSNLLEVVRRLV